MLHVRSALKLGTHYLYVHGPCSRAHGVQNDARVHGPQTRPLNTGVKNDTRIHGCHFLIPVNTGRVNTGVILDTVFTVREHGPWTYR